MRQLVHFLGQRARFVQVAFQHFQRRHFEQRLQNAFQAADLAHQRQPLADVLLARLVIQIGQHRLGEVEHDPRNPVAIPDLAPTVELTEQPRGAARGATTLFYKLGDDYGVASAEAVFDQPELADRPAEGRLLHEPPRAQLPLGAGAGGLGEARASVDVSDHPWAGARVRLTVKARDEGGGEGASAPIHIFLPQRPFTNPLARALVVEPVHSGIVRLPQADQQVGVVGGIEHIMKWAQHVRQGLRGQFRRSTRAG